MYCLQELLVKQLVLIHLSYAFFRMRLMELLS
jgi:hypothetical protein